MRKMEIGEIISDALVYPFSNIKALIIYLILGIIFGIVFVSTLVAIAAGIEANNVFAVFGIGIIGGVVSIFLGFMINGYQLDVIKYLEIGMKISSHGVLKKNMVCKIINILM